MEFKSLSIKKLNGESDMYNMTPASIVFLPTTEVIAEHTVTEDEIGRMDLISLKYYSDSNYVDYILKWNNISNPFAITFGDVLEIPEKTKINKDIKPIKMVGNSTGAPSIRDQFIDTKRLPAKDAKRIEYLQRKAAQKANGSSQILPPNILKDGETNAIIGNGTINI